MTVNYDFKAADLLVWALTNAAEKTTAQIGVRRTSRASLLGDTPGVYWQGKHRNDFEKEFARLQRALMALEDDLRRALKLLRQATERAHEIDKKKPEAD